MGTSYYLADSRYMTEMEIKEARHNQDSIICHRSFGGRDQEGNPKIMYRLDVPGQIFFHLPRDILLVNNNNDTEADTIGDLITQIIRVRGKIITLEEGIELDKTSQGLWLLTRPDTEEWKAFISEGCGGFTPTNTVMQYLERGMK